MYIPQLQVPGETSVADASFLNTQATKATKGCNAAAPIVLFCTGIHGFKKDSHNTCCHPQTHPGRQAFLSSGSKEPRSAHESRRVSLGAHWVP